METTLTSKGQLTLPVSLRHSLSLKAGDKFIVEEHIDGAVILRPKSTDITVLKGIVNYSGKKLSLNQIQEAIELESTC